MECRMVQSAISGQRTIMYHTPHDDAYVCMCMYVKNRQHQHQHTRVHAHTGSGRARRFFLRGAPAMIHVG